MITGHHALSASVLHHSLGDKLVAERKVRAAWPGHETVAILVAPAVLIYAKRMLEDAGLYTSQMQIDF